MTSAPVPYPYGSGASGWMVSKYDALSRVGYSAFYTGTAVTLGGRKSLQDNVNNNTPAFEKRIASNSVDGVTIPYTNTTFPKDGLILLAVNYYDDYDFLGNVSRPASIEGQAVITNVKGLPTGGWTRVLTSTGERLGNRSYMLYDFNSRVLRSNTANYLNGYTEVDTKYSFIRLPLTVSTEHRREAYTPAVKIVEKYTYDHAERLLYQTHKVDSGAEVVLYENVYDELGALEKKRVGGTLSGNTPAPNTFLQEIGYKYNIRGWLTEVNDVANLNATAKRALFAYKLNYNKTEQGLGDVKALYNGNISEQIWKSALDNKQRGYGYAYDGVNRLVLGAFAAPDLNSPSTKSLYDERIAYDKNGNITRLDRNGATLGGVVIAIDNLTYGYEVGSNKLSTVRDGSGNQAGFKQVNTSGVDYSYDSYGNLEVDRHKRISKIRYNHQHLPVDINFGTDKIEYLYTASGEKTQKKVTEKGVVTLTDYLDGFQYVKGKLSFLPTAEGFFNAETNAYVYQYKDHLGNVRLSYSDKNNNNTIEASEIIEESNYYPFGLAHKGYNQKNDALMKDYKYQYNGKERQEELGLNYYDYGARNYDAAIGRWMNVDPLAEKYVSFTPYAYVGNRPLNAIDPDGKKIVYIIRGKGNIKDATFIYRDGNFYNKKNEIFTPDKNKHSSMYKVLNAYNRIEKSGDKELNKVLSTLVSSKTIHYVEQGNRDNKVTDSERKGLKELKENFIKGESVSSHTNYNFSEKSSKEFEESTGVSNSPFTTVVHEMSHQYDYDQGNMGDSVGKQSSATDPAEIRAVRLENRARKLEGLPKRTKYGGEEIEPKKLN